MRQRTTIVFLVALAAASACHKSHTPTDTLREFWKAAVIGDSNAASRRCVFENERAKAVVLALIDVTSASIEYVKAAKEIPNVPDLQQSIFNIQNPDLIVEKKLARFQVSVSGDLARVAPIDQSGTSRSFYLVERDGEWKVDVKDASALDPDASETDVDLDFVRLMAQMWRKAAANIREQHPRDQAALEAITNSRMAEMKAAYAAARSNH